MFDAGPLRIPVDQQAALRAAYATPVRAYHSIVHVQEVLRHYDQVAQGPGWAQPSEVWLAALYHDAIYEAGRGDNETRSAMLAMQHIAKWLSGAGIDATRVASLIGLTARHGRVSVEDLVADCNQADTCHFLDCDMAILGADAASFDAYDAGIATEYRGHMPAWLFKLNRRRFLKNLLAKQRIFLSDWFHQRLDAAARANLRRALGT